MALKISKNSALTDIVSEDNTNPITTEHPISGSTVEMKLWLFDDGNPAGKRYETITIDPIDSVNTDESTWVQLAPDNAGVAGVYGAASAVLSMANITVSNVGTPFWVKVTSPAVADSQNKTDIKLQVKAKQFAQ